MIGFAVDRRGRRSPAPVARGACPRRRCGPRPAGRRPGTTRRSPRRAVAERLGRVRVELRQRLDEGRLRVGERRSGPAGASVRRCSARRSTRSSSRVSEKVGSSESSVVEHPLLARVGVDQLDQLGRAAGELEVAQRLARRPGRSRRSSRTRATCCRSSPGRRARACAGRARRTRRTSPPPRARAASRSR